MNPKILERLLKAKRTNGKSYVVLMGIKDILIPFTCIAKQYDFPLDGVIVMDQPQVLSEAYSGFPIVDLNNYPFPPKQTLLVLAIPAQLPQDFYRQLWSNGFQAFVGLNSLDMSEMFTLIQHKNFLLDKVRDALRRNNLNRTLLFDSGAKISILKNVLNMPGFPLDGTVQSVDQTSCDALLMFPIENQQHKQSLQALEQQNVHVLPLYPNDLLTTEHYWNVARIFYDYFDLNNVPDFVSRYETQSRFILNAYQKVNLSLLYVEDDAEVMKACALALLMDIDKVLHVVLPISRQGNIVNYQAGADNFLLKQLRHNIKVISLESREFWRYFIKRYPLFVEYSNSLYNYYVCKYIDGNLNVRAASIEFTAEELKSVPSESYAVFSLSKRYDWQNVIENRLRERGLQSVILSNSLSSAESAALIKGARLMISDRLSDRYAAMIYGVPLVSINMTTFTLDEQLSVRAPETMTVMLPKLYHHVPTKRTLSFQEIWRFEEQIPDVAARKDFYKHNQVESLDNTQDEIWDAIVEMLSRLDGNFKQSDEEEFTHKTFHKWLGWSKDNRSRDVYDSHVSIKFLQRHKELLSLLTYAQREALLIKNFIPPAELATLTARSKNKIKVRVFFVIMHIWNVNKTICESCLKDNDIDLLIIVMNAREKEFLSQQGYNCVYQNEYDIKSDRPDVIMISNMFGESHRTIGDIRKYAKLVIVSVFPLVLYGGLDTFIRNVESQWAPYNPDYYLFESYLYKKLKPLDYFKDKPLVETGNPKYDGIYTACRDIKSVKGWEKLDGKKIILYAPDHGTNAGIACADQVGVDFFAGAIFQYAFSNPDMGLIFRPHPDLIRELTDRFNFWSGDDLDNFRRYCANSPNIVFDETENYNNAYALASAVVTSPWCGIVMSALPTGKPICPDAVKHCYRVFSVPEMFNFFGMIERGEDPMREFRQQKAKEYVKHFDGKNGWRIKEFIKQAFKNKLG